jgi:hypothetical protein
VGDFIPEIFFGKKWNKTALGCSYPYMQSLKVRGLAPVVALAASLAVSLSARSAPPEDAVNAAGNAATAPNWQLKDLDSKTVRSSDFKGKVVILDFWATWCVELVINCGERNQRKGKEKFGNSALNHCLAPVAVDGQLRYGAHIQIERSGI